MRRTAFDSREKKTRPIETGGGRDPLDVADLAGWRTFYRGKKKKEKKRKRKRSPLFFRPRSCYVMARKVVVRHSLFRCCDDKKRKKKKKEKGRKIGAKRHRKLILERYIYKYHRLYIGGEVVDYWLARVKSGSSTGDRDWFLAAVSRSGSNGK